MTATPPLVDTNILVCLFDLDRPEKRECAKTIVEECFSGTLPLSVSVQNLARVFGCRDGKSGISPPGRDGFAIRPRYL